MDDVKNKMYNYETTPPDGVWEAIAAELGSNEAKIIPMAKKKNKTFYYIAAASVAIILFCLLFFTNRSSKSNEQFTSSTNKEQSDTVIKTTTIITVPVDEKTTAKNNDELAPKHKVEKDNINQKQNKEIKKETDDNNMIASNTARYITIEGPQGQPVKISSKMATLIDSSETKIASKPIWNKKINEWREIMKANTLAPTPGNFLDIIELTKSLKDNK